MDDMSDGVRDFWGDHGRINARNGRGCSDSDTSKSEETV